MAQKISFLFIFLGLALLIVPVIKFKAPATLRLDQPLQPELLLPIPVKLSTLNSQKVTSLIEKTLILLTFSRLVKNGEQLQIEPDMLSKWSYDLGDRKLHLSVRPGVLFHDGKPLTGADVIFSMYRWARPENPDHELLSSIKGLRDYSLRKRNRIQGIRAIDSMTVEIELEQWGAEALIKNLSNPRFCVFPENFGGRSEAEYFRNPVGTGPYKLLTYSANESVFEANPNYYLGGPATKRIRLRYMNLDAAILAFRAKKVDNLILYHIPQPHQLEAPDVIIRRFSGMNTLSLFFNTELPGLRHEKLRRFIASKIDKKILAARCFPGATIASHFIPPGLMGSFPSTENFAPNNANLGVDSKEIANLAVPALTLFLATDENGDCNRKVLAQQLDGLPIDVEVRTFPELFERLMNHRLNIWLEVSEFRTDDPIHNLQYFSSASGEFLLGKPITWLENQFKGLNHHRSLLERADIYRSMDNYLVDHTYVFPILHFSNFVVYRQNVTGLEFLRTARLATQWHLIKVRPENVSGT